MELRIGYIPIADCAHLYVASAQGLWAAHGLQVEETSMAGGARILEALAAGALDLGFSNVISLAIARSRGLPFVAVGGAVVEDAQHAPHRLLLRADLPFSGPADLRGKRIAVNTLRNIDQLVLGEYLAGGGVGLSEVTLREIPFPRMEGVLTSGELDAASGIEPYVTISESNPALALGPNHYLQVAPRTLVSSYVMNQEQARGPAGEAVRAVLVEAAAWIAEHDAETRALVAQRTGLDQAVTTVMGMSRMESAPVPEDLKAMIQRAAAADLLGQPPTTDELLGLDGGTAKP